MQADRTITTDDPRALEELSSAVTLSDMELFIFPDLLYALVLANLMSPRIWAWKQDPWFAGMERMKPYRRIARLKQYVMDHYVFNLDLETWGLTTKERELRRFRRFVDADTLAESNALFGYEGDRYYFDLDIRTHFGLDRYDSNVIPYWKTETVEAMDAFRHRDGFSTGAGECVSLSALYAAALFIVAGIPLSDIYLMATPLHSQNFVDVDDGILTNNRRLVTRNMWFNGTALSAQARRALENERVTIVSHASGYVHTLYPEATIDPASYARFSARLQAFLRTSLTAEVLGNFVRHTREIQRCFQFRWPIHGADHFIALERLMAYEQGCPFLLTDATRPKLMQEVDMEEFVPSALPGRIVFNDLENFVRGARTDIHDPGDLARLREAIACDCFDAESVMLALRRFCNLEPQLPRAGAKRFAAAAADLGLDPSMGRDALVARIADLRPRLPTAAKAFHAFRDLGSVDAAPFVHAATQRNPVSIAATANEPLDALAARVAAMPDVSIYDGPGRLAQPDEVWNFGRGDGLEKAVLMANLVRSREPGEPVTVHVSPTHAVVSAGEREYSFASAKGIVAQDWVVPGGDSPA